MTSTYYRYPSAGGVTLPVSIANGGTGQTTATAAINALLPSQTGNNGKVLGTDGTNTSWVATSGTGTVTSVDMTVPAFLAVSGNPITAAGTLAVTLSGTALPVANGGTGQTTATAAFGALSPLTTKGDIIVDSGSANVRLAVGSNNTFLHANSGATNGVDWAQVGLTTGVTGTLPIANGGTGQTTASAAFDALSPMTTAGDLIYGGASGTGTRRAIGSTGNVLTVAGGVPTWAAPATSGTVTSVALTMPAIFSVAGSPITSSGTLAVTLATETANTVWSGPTSGGAATPTFRALVTADIPSNLIIASAGVVIDGGGSAITTGSKGFIQIPYGATVSSWTVLADQSGSIVVDVKRSTYAGFPTTTSIVGGGGNKPTLSSVQNNTAAPSSWTSTAITAGDVLEFNVDSATTVTRVTVQLKLTRT